MPKFDKHLKYALQISVGLVLLLTAALLVWPQKTSTVVRQIFDPQPPPPKTTTIFLAGDIMLSRNVADRMIKANNYNLPFEKTADVSKSADIAFANLESPFLDKPPYAQQGLVFKVEPQAVAGLIFAGFDILSTANNHAYDQGTKGLDFTIDTLINNGIIPTGTRKTTGDEPLPVIKKNDILYGFLSYSYTAKNDGGKSTSPYINDYNDLTKLKQDILSLKGHTADVMIVNMHAGVEYTRTPTAQQIAFAHTAIDAGADLVVGEHSHWVQTVEQYKGKWILYGLGNFVFDQMWSTETRQGLTALVTYENKDTGPTITNIELKPVIIDDFCCVRFADPTESSAILGNIGLTSNNLLDHN